MCVCLFVVDFFISVPHLKIYSKLFMRIFFSCIKMGAELISLFFFKIFIVAFLGWLFNVKLTIHEYAVGVNGNALSNCTMKYVIVQFVGIKCKKQLKSVATILINDIHNSQYSSNPITIKIYKNENIFSLVLKFQFVFIVGVARTINGFQFCLY